MLTEAQHELRQTCLGGSDLACIATGRFGGLLGVILSKRGQPAEIANDEAMEIEHGNWSEGPGLDWFERDTGNTLARDVRAVHNSLGSRIAVNLDGRTADGVPVEHKYVTTYRERFWGDDPDDYTTVQAHAEMLCCETDHAYVVVTMNYKCRFWMRVQRNDVLCKAIDQLGRYVWETYVAPPRIPSLAFEKLPEHRTHQRVREVLNATKIVTNQISQLDERDQHAAQLWETAKRAATAFGNGADALRDWLLMRVGDSEIGSLPDGSILKRKIVKRKGFTVEPSEHVELKRTKLKELDNE